MSAEVAVQFATDAAGVPDESRVAAWVRAALIGRERTEVSVRIVDAEEGAHLNKAYRHKEGPTNVLAFPAEIDGPAGRELLGDVVICAPVAAAEADRQGKSPEAHWAHLVIHGILHLQGFGHENPADAAIMEKLEVDILARLGYSNPYEAGVPAADARGNGLPQ